MADIIDAEDLMRRLSGAIGKARQNGDLKPALIVIDMDGMQHDVPADMETITYRERPGGMGPAVIIDLRGRLPS